MIFILIKFTKTLFVFLENVSNFEINKFDLFDVGVYSFKSGTREQSV